MRISREPQISLFRQFSEHEFSEDLARISALLDTMPQINHWVLSDLSGGSGTRPQGAKGMSAEEVLRSAILMRINDWTYRELEYHLRDSADARAFARIREGECYSFTTLQGNISKIQPKTWEDINRELIIPFARKEKIEQGTKVRVDSTVAPTNIHHPTDSALLLDCVRVLERIVTTLGILTGFRFPKLPFSSRKARKLFLAILNAKNEESRRPLYEKLVVGAGDDWYLIPSILKKASSKIPTDHPDFARLMEIQSLMEGIIAQTIARVFDGESVQASEKVVSIFEPHTDVIVKGRRDTEFGHKIFLTTGASNLVLDCMIPDGNPCDASLFVDMIRRLKEIYNKSPKKIAADGGFASHENLEKAKEEGVVDVCFSKRLGKSIDEMCRSRDVYQKLRDFRAGVESNISALKRAFGLGKVLWRGRVGYNSCVWSGIIAYNLMIIAAELRPV